MSGKAKDLEAEGGSDEPRSLNEEARAAQARGQTVHCWADGPTTWYPAEGDHYGRVAGSTCMLMHGHAGEHEWTPDAAIKVTFAPYPESDA